MYYYLMLDFFILHRFMSLFNVHYLMLYFFVLHFLMLHY